MTPATAKNLADLFGCDVRITWAKDDDDWPYFRLVGIQSKDDTIWLMGIDYPESEGGHRHRGDSFWVDLADVKRIERVDMTNTIPHANNADVIVQ